MFHRIETRLKSDFPDPIGHKVQVGISSDLHLEVKDIRTTKVLALLGEFSDADAKRVGEDLFFDPIIEELSFGRPDYPSILPSFTHAVQVTFLPGVTDNLARSAKEATEDLLGKKLRHEDHVFSATVYLLAAPGLSTEEVDRVVAEILHNPVIEKVTLLTRAQIEEGKDFASFEAPPEVETPKTQSIKLSDLSDDALVKLSSQMVLALTLEEMKAIQAHYVDPENRSRRESLGLGEDPTDLELEALAQTWSEHCKHKIFAAEVDYTDTVSGEEIKIDSLFKTMIYDPTIDIMTRRPDISSVFSDNAGAFNFDDELDVCIKAETHNSPSALDPYGGAMTGIVGVNRDVMGTGRGFLPIFNTDVFCFGPPDYAEPLPGRLHHPRRIFRGVHRGVKDGGNESGIPTVNGSISFDDRFIGKPLVFCGTGGIAPRNLGGKPIVEKWIKPGDLVVMLGGLIGKDGIHGATFSSEGLSSASPTSAVQIGDPITQKRMTDFLIVARDRELYDFITDNGAGGLSSSLGEMAEECGGVSLDLSLAPLKYAGLAPWEIFVSEAQERMSLSVPPAKVDAFLKLATEMRVVATVLGSFSDSGYLEIFYGEEQVASLSMEFLHKGLPTLKLKATWTPPENPELTDADLPELSEGLCEKVISRFNICSKEDWVRQYDHEVQGMSVVKPFCGEAADAPSDAAVLRPSLKHYKGLAIAHGLLPRYSDIDTYAMTCNVMDEALRSLVASGADPDTALGLDNFCWPDPVATAKNPDGEYKMAQLVRSNMALRDMALATGMACISGKDSMKNDYVDEDVRISIPPTLLFTAIATLPDVRRSVTMDFKKEGDIIVLLGETKDELGGSEFYQELGLLGNNVPQVQPVDFLNRYRKLHGAMQDGLVHSAHDLSEGGLLVTLAESCFGGRLGAKVDLAGNLHPIRELFSESAGRILLTVSQSNLAPLKVSLAGEPLTVLGEVTSDYNISGLSCPLSLERLYRAWRQPLKTLE